MNVKPVSMKAFTCLAIVLMSFGCEGYLTSEDTRRNALKYARNYASVSYPQGSVSNIACSGIDRDHNGYVTCVLNFTTGQSPVQIECTANWVWEFDQICRPVNFRTFGVQDQ